MVNVAAALAHLYPEAESLIDYVVRDDGDGAYIYAWNLPGPRPTDDELASAAADATKARVWGQIKAERDRRKALGTKVGDYWFHSDADSRIQQLGLVLLGANIPPNTHWKTMTGEFVPMTQQLAGQIFASTALSDMAVFAKAEQHKAAMEASADPENYDYLTGWPETFGA